MALPNGIRMPFSAESLRRKTITAMQVGMDRRIEVHGTGGMVLHEPLGSNRLRVHLQEGTEKYPAGEWHDVEIECWSCRLL